MKVVLEESLEDKMICTGFKGVGSIGRLSMKYLLKSAERGNTINHIGYILSPTQPPFVEVTQKGVGTPYEIAEVGDIVFLNIRFPPLLKEQVRLAKAITDKAKKEKARGFLLLGGLDKRVAKRVYEEEPLPVVGVSNFEDPFLSRMGVDRTPEGILISGGVALILSYTKHFDVPSLALFSPGEKGKKERKSALRLARKVSDFFDLELEFEGIEEEILLSKVAEKQREEIEKKMKKRKEERVSDLFT